MQLVHVNVYFRYTLAHWSKKERIPQLIAVTGGRGRYKVYLGKKKSFILVGVVLDHDVNIKKEVLLLPSTYPLLHA